jgi:predicted small metal-binding protein
LTKIPELKGIGALHQCVAFIDIQLCSSLEKRRKRRKSQMPSFMCKDIGIDCPFEAHGTTNHELMRKFIDHAEPAHKMHVLSADVIYKVQNAIKK